eukprot:3341553-Prymnesium_polylepis.1
MEQPTRIPASGGLDGASAATSSRSKPNAEQPHTASPGRLRVERRDTREAGRPPARRRRKAGALGCSGPVAVPGTLLMMVLERLGVGAYCRLAATYKTTSCGFRVIF